MADALVGYSGFVGSTLLRQRQFDALFRSTNIGDIAGKAFKTVYCAGAPAQKWLANKNPIDDLANIEALIRCLDKVEADEFVLISTVDVFASPVSVDEDTVPNKEGLHAYGRHRLMLEEYVKSRSSRNLIVRLPGLVGPGLKKNIIYDYAHGNQ
ncbi:MAG: pyridine nucleotide transhydrogenase, partial [Cytophagaceae bacterium]